MKAKKIITYLIVAFAVYLVVAKPAKAAGLVHSAFNGIAMGGHSVMRFFDALVA